MKKFFFKVIFLFLFIIYFSFSAIAAQFGISSVSYDNSSAFMVLNSIEVEEFNIKKPIIYTVEAENRIYFDIDNAYMNCATQNLVIDSSTISEINVSQISHDPNVVRVEIMYKDGFNPSDIHLKKAGNTLFVQFKYPAISNYYFQGVMQGSAVQSFFEDIKMNVKVPDIKQSILGQINSSFGVAKTADTYSLSEKNLLLRSKYYIEDLGFIGKIPIITGIGSYNISKPIYLTNPSRVAYDIPNSVVNPALRNQEIPFGQNESIKIGQFDKTTSRIVISSNDPEKFIPVIYPDTQRLVFYDSKNVSSINLYSATANLSSVKYEKNDSLSHSVKFIFNNPIIYGLNRKSNELELYFYNLSSTNSGQIISALKNSPFEKIKITEIKDGSPKIVFSTNNGESIDIHLGTDGKTLRIKEKFKTAFIPEPEEKVTIPDFSIPSMPEKIKGKHYVLIDAGHGGNDVGATRNNIYEKDITLDIAKRVEKLLKKKGYVVAMTRDDDSTLSLQERVDISEVFNPDIFISIHVNSSNNEAPNGLETHYYKENSLYLAKCVHASLLNNINAKDRGLFKSKFYVINHTTAPAILVETGFISNPTERAQLASDSRKNSTAKAIVEGIDEYFK